MAAKMYGMSALWQINLLPLLHHLDSYIIKQMEKGKNYLCQFGAVPIFDNPRLRHKKSIIDFVE